MNTFQKSIFAVIVIFAGILAFFSHQSQITSLQVGATNFNPTGGATYRLQSTLSSTQTTITLISFKEPVSNTLYTMTYLNSSIEYGTIGPQTSTSEFISFTGITQNADGTATLTGVTRGLSRSYPYTASATFQQPHSSQSIFILSDAPQVFNQYYALGNTATSTGILYFSSTTPPRYDLVPANQAVGTFVATTAELASVAYVNAVALVSASNASTGAKGVVQIATGAQTAAGTASGSTGALLTVPTSLFNATQSATTIVPVTNSSGKLSQSFLDLTQAFTWSGANIFTSSTNTFNSLARFNLAPEFGTFNATSSLVTSTSTISGNLNILLNASTTNLKVTGTCVGCVSGYERIQNNTALVTSTNGTATSTATCSAGKKVIGGGWSGPQSSNVSSSGFFTGGSTGGAYSFNGAYPDTQSSFSAVVTCVSGSSCPAGTLSAYAICVNI